MKKILLVAVGALAGLLFSIVAPIFVYMDSDKISVEAQQMYEARMRQKKIDATPYYYHTTFVKK